MIIINRYSRCIIAFEKDKGIAIPKDCFNIDEFIEEVRKEALTHEEYKEVRIVSLVYDKKFTRNYFPMKKFLESRSSWNFQDDETVSELFRYFFANSKKTIYKDGYVEYDFHI